MNKSDLVTAMAQKSGLTKKSAELALDAFTKSIQTAMKKKEKVTLVGFGTWEVRQRAARKGINPQTGKKMDIPKKFVPVFRAGKTLRSTTK